MDIYEIFESVLSYIYRGSTDITVDIAPDLLQIADYYLLDGLKTFCETKIPQILTLEIMPDIFKCARDYHGYDKIKDACTVFALKHYLEFRE
ncbi:arm repeat protein interacting with abf2-like protein, partial [Trifolium pratense]